MRVVITQPTFLPWLGYLGQMASCDFFVCLDSVQFARRSWQSRNRIVSRHGKVDYLNVNVRKGERGSALNNTFISDEYKPEDLQAKAAAYYYGCRRVQEGGAIFKPLCSAYHRPGFSLSDANVRHLIHLSNLMGLSIPIKLASVLERGLRWETPTERLLALCQSLGATTYLSSPGAHPYMKNELHKFSAAGIKVLWQEFTHIAYVDRAPFISHLSCVDFLYHRPVDELLPYVLECNRFITEEKMIDKDSVNRLAQSPLSD